jgi:hypothetical protein
MRKPYLLFIILLLIVSTFNARAQSGFSDIIKVSPSDATKLIQAYGDPLFKGFGAGMNSGWTNTAKVKKLLRFDFRVSASAAFTPASDKSFDLSKLGLSNALTPADPNQTITPTITGERATDGPVLNINDAQGHKISSFNMPSGKLPVIPAPQLQLTIGLLQNTDFTIRAIPSIKVSNDVGSVSMIGFGLKHDLTQYIFGPAKKIVPFDLSMLFAYSRLNLNDDLDVQPDAGSAHDANDPNQNTDFSTQRTNAHFTSFVAQAIISKKLAVFTPFLAVGYNTASASLAAMGNYPVITGINEGTGQETYSVYTNPVNIHETTISGMRADIGFQLDVGVHIFASASLAQYTSVNAGLGFGF